MNTTLLQNNVIFRIDFSVWTGKAKLSRADLPPDAKIPPEDLAILGQKRLIDPDTLKPFMALKTKTIRLADKYGVKFLSGWLVNESYVDELDSGLLGIRDEFYDVKRDFIAAYHNNVTTWIQQHPQWQAMLASVLPTDADMEKKFNLSWQVYRVTPVATQGSSMDDEVAHVVSDDVKSLTDELRLIYETTFRDRTTPVTKRTIGPLETFEARCHNLVGIYPSATYMRDAVSALLDSLRLPLEPTSVGFSQLMLALETMSDAEKMGKCITTWMQQGCAGDMLSDVMADQQPEPPVDLAKVLDEAAESIAPQPVFVPAGEPLPKKQTSLADLMDDLF